ncbi:aspartyl protease family protein At5g10770 [Setaria italica]|nr:aspartyl protease family protein At5g10770 [Setaria italica]
MASHRSLVRLLVLCLLCVASLAAKRRYLSVSLDELLSSKAHVDCPPTKKSVTTSGNKLTIPASCAIPKCCGAGESTGRHVINHDKNRLSTLLQRSSVSSAPPSAPPSALAVPIPRTPLFPFPPAPSVRPFPGIPFPFPPAPSARPFPGIPFPFPPAPSVRPFPGIPFPFPPAPSARPFPGIPFPFPPAPSARPIPDTSSAQAPRSFFPGIPLAPAPSARPFPGIPFPFPPAPSARPFPGIPFPFPPAPSAGPIPDTPSAQAPRSHHFFPGIPLTPAPSARPFPGIPFQFPPAPSARPPFPGIPFPPISVSPVAPPAEPPAVTIPDSSGAYLDTLEFVVTVGFGTPARAYAVVFDTGSDVSWIQCQPCSGHCYKQHDPIFDPAKSSTYAAVPCGHPECKAAGGQCDSNGTCTYKVEYGDGSSTSGVLSHETLSLTSSSALHSFVFGCGENNLGPFGDVDGLIGLGRGQFSLSSQAASSLGATFSYCLPSHNGTQGYLTIGSTPVSDKAAYTAMVQKPDYPSFYFVELVSIDIGGYVLPVPPTVFTSAGTLLDSGTILTYLPEQAYALLRDRFKFTMKQYKPAPPTDILDTCYDFTGQRAIFIPAVSFKFSDGAVFDLDFFGVLLFPDEATAIGCLAFAARPPTMPFNIVGNTQQRSAEVIYDVAAEKIGFVPASC